MSDADNDKRAEDKNQYGNLRYSRQEYTNAIYLYTDAISLRPQIAKYHGNRSQCYIKMNKFMEALSDAKKSIELDPGFFKSYIRIITCCLSCGESTDLKLAEKTLITAKGIFLEDADVKQLNEQEKLLQYINENINNFITNFNNKRYTEALSFIENCLSKFQLCIYYNLKRAECLLRMHKYDEAEKIADDILKQKKTNEEALYIKHCCKYYRDDNDVQELKRQLPDHSKTDRLFRKATITNKTMSKINEAIEKLQFQQAYKLTDEIIKLDENHKIKNKRLYLKKIEIAAKDKNLLWEGTKDCTEYMSIYGNDIKILKTRAKYYIDLLEFEDAKTDYEAIVKLEKNKENEDVLKSVTKSFDEQIKDCYKILHISDKAKKNDIIKAHKTLIMRYHPDKNQKVSQERKSVLEQKTIRINTAREKLLTITKK